MTIFINFYTVPSFTAIIPQSAKIRGPLTNPKCGQPINIGKTILCHQEVRGMSSTSTANLPPSSTTKTEIQNADSKSRWYEGAGKRPGTGTYEALLSRPTSRVDTDEEEETKLGASVRRCVDSVFPILLLSVQFFLLIHGGVRNLHGDKITKIGWFWRKTTSSKILQTVDQPAGNDCTAHWNVMSASTPSSVFFLFLEHLIECFRSMEEKTATSKGNPEWQCMIYRFTSRCRQCISSESPR